MRVPIFIRGGKGTTEGILRQLRDHGFDPGVAIRCDSPRGVKTAVQSKMGLGILYKDIVEPEIRRGDFKVIKLPGLNLEGESFIVFHRDKPLSANAGDFLALMRGRHRKRRKVRKYPQAAWQETL